MASDRPYRCLFCPKVYKFEGTFRSHNLTVHQPVMARQETDNIPPMWPAWTSDPAVVSRFIEACLSSVEDGSPADIRVTAAIGEVPSALLQGIVGAMRQMSGPGYISIPSVSGPSTPVPETIDTGSEDRTNDGGYSDISSVASASVPSSPEPVPVSTAQDDVAAWMMESSDGTSFSPHSSWGIESSSYDDDDYASLFM